MINKTKTFLQDLTAPSEKISNPVDRQNAGALTSLLGLFMVLALIGMMFPGGPQAVLLGLFPILLISFLIVRTHRWKLGGWIAFIVLSILPFIGAAVHANYQHPGFIMPLVYLAIPGLMSTFLLNIYGIIVVVLLYSASIILLPMYIPLISSSQVWATYPTLLTLTIFNIVVARHRERKLYAYVRSKERAAAIKTLEENEKKYRSLFNFANDAILLVDPKTYTILDINENSTTHFGFPPEELVGNHVDTLLSPSREGDTFLISENLGRTKQAVFESRLVHQEGYDIPVEFSSRLVEYGRVSVFHCLVRDISERTFAEEQMHRYSERLETLHQIEQAMTSVQSPEDIATVALPRLRQVVNCRRASLTEINFSNREVLFIGVDEDASIQNLPQPGERVPIDEIRIAEEFHDGALFFEKDISSEKSPKKLETQLVDAGISSYISLPIYVQSELWGTLNLCGPLPRETFSSANIEVALEVVRPVAVSIQQTNLVSEIRLGRARLQGLSRRLVEAQEAERQRIANELHDEIGQALTGINLSLETHIRTQEKDVEHSALLEAQKTAQELISRVQAISLDLRPAMLDDLGLLPTLTWHFDRYESQTDIKVIFKHSRLQERFSSEIETAAYRIVQEALTNVARHSNVKEVKVHASLEDDIVLIFVEDRGGGFSVDKALISGDASGLVGMRERALSLGGDLTIISTEGSGSQILAKLPLYSRIERRTIERSDD